MLRRGTGAMVGAPWNCNSLPSGPDDGLHVCIGDRLHAGPEIRPPG